MFDKFLSTGDFSEDDVFSVEPGGGDSGDEELGAIGVGSCVGHGEQEGFAVFKFEVLICELGAVDGLASSSVVVGEVSSL